MNEKLKFMSSTPFLLPNDVICQPVIRQLPAAIFGVIAYMSAVICYIYSSINRQLSAAMLCVARQP